MKSNCHNAPIKTQHADEGTSYYICTACDKACDTKYKDISDFFHNASPEEQKEVLMEAVGKANQDQKALVDKVDLIETVTERIVMDYADLSGRESDNRAVFRLRTRKNLCHLIKKLNEKL